jgi:hypothetical protein
MKVYELKVKVKNNPSKDYDCKINESIKALLDDISIKNNL